MALSPDVAGLLMSGVGFTLVYRPGGQPESGPLAGSDGITPLIPVGLFINLPGNQNGSWVIESADLRLTAAWNDATGDWDVA